MASRPHHLYAPVSQPIMFTRRERVRPHLMPNTIEEALDACGAHITDNDVREGVFKFTINGVEATLTLRDREVPPPKFSATDD